MTYSALVKGCVQAGLVDKAVQLTRNAYGLAPPMARGKAVGISARCRDDLVAALSESESTVLLAEIAECTAVVSASTSSSRTGSRQAKGSGKGHGAARPPWRQQK